VKGETFLLKKTNKTKLQAKEKKNTSLIRIGHGNISPIEIQNSCIIQNKVSCYKLY